MIRPTKYLDLSTSVIRVAALLLEELRRVPLVPLNDLREFVRTCAGDKAKYNFLPALNFLYLTGKIEYNEQADAIRSLVAKEVR